MAMQALPAAGVRDNRLTTLVSDTEIKLISEMAAVSGMSVSAYLRERALGPSADPLEAAALEKIDALIGGMERKLDEANAELAAALSRMAAP
jgi:hypothetical protein